MSINEATGSENIPDCVLKTFANQLADVITDILTFLSALRQPTFVPVLNRLLCVVLMTTVLWHSPLSSWMALREDIPASLDPHQYAFKTNTSREDALSTAYHSSTITPFWIINVGTEFQVEVTNVSRIKPLGWRNTYKVCKRSTKPFLDCST